jgi:hypothetical protein
MSPEVAFVVRIGVASREIVLKLNHKTKICLLLDIYDVIINHPNVN